MDTVELVEDILRAVVGLIGADQAKASLDKVAVEMANLAADELEDQKFGKVDPNGGPK